MEKCFYLEAVDAVRYERTRYTVVIKLKPQPRGRLAQIIKSEDLRAVDEWSVANNCGNRVSFDTWEFTTESDRLMFLLRWASGD